MRSKRHIVRAEAIRNEPIPIGLALRKQSRSRRGTVTLKTKLSTIDEELARLSRDDDSSEEDLTAESTTTVDVQTDEAGKVVKLLSANLRDEAIAPLPKQCLPLPNNGKAFTMKKRGLGLGGIESTVRDLLRNYEPASREKRPFWCRVCRFQGQSLEDFDRHKASDFHNQAVHIEKKVSTCQLCRKQFTSPDQLKEHLRGKSHKERLARLKSNNSKSVKFA